MKKTILFDFDGTLINSTKAVYNGFVYAFENSIKLRQIYLM